MSALYCLLTLLPALIGPPPAAVRAPATAPAADVRIVFWYERGRPLDTFRYQVYDLGRKEYSPAVDRWLAGMKARHPGFEAYPRDVVLAREHGGTRELKIGSAILREFLVLGNRHGYDFAGVSPAASAARPVTPRSLPPLSRGSPLPAAPPAPFPVPMPYPRPHP